MTGCSPRWRARALPARGASPARASTRATDGWWRARRRRAWCASARTPEARGPAAFSVWAPRAVRGSVTGAARRESLEVPQQQRIEARRRFQHQEVVAVIEHIEGEAREGSADA